MLFIRLHVAQVSFLVFQSRSRYCALSDENMVQNTQSTTLFCYIREGNPTGVCVTGNAPVEELVGRALQEIKRKDSSTIPRRNQASADTSQRGREIKNATRMHSFVTVGCDIHIDLAVIHRFKLGGC